MKFKTYRRRGFETGRWRYRWRIRASNGKIVDSSSQAFYSERSARRNAMLTLECLLSAVATGQL